MLNGAKLFKKSIWDGKLMPSILRGSKAHNEKLLAQRSKETETSERQVSAPTPEQVSAPISASHQKGSQELFQKAQALIETLESMKNSESVKEVTATAPTNLSCFYAAEVLELSPPTSPVTSPVTSPQKPRQGSLVLSPFSKAKAEARVNGVNLSEECRGVYTDQELTAKIAFLAAANAKLETQLKM